MMVYGAGEHNYVKKLNFVQITNIIMYACSSRHI